MKRYFLLLAATFTILLSATAQNETKKPVFDIIPKPVSLVKGSGFFKLTSQVNIIAPKALKDLAGLLKEKLSYTSNNISPNTKPGTITFELKKKDTALGKEGYRLSVSPSVIRIVSATKEGAVHGLFTLLQLQQIQTDEQLIPCLEITDKPRFAYRGFMLDVSRHFFPVSFIKKLLDLMALYKLNTFHWHLTDGGGWRLQIKKYPLLTKVAAWRPQGSYQQWDRHLSQQGDPDAYGGYYTPAEAKEVVQYAAARGITVIPEIEMPAHSEEVLAVYPQLSCSGEPYKNSSFCIGNDSTFTFLEDVLTEVMKIFPSEYIHIGGDEANMSSWKTCPKDQALMKRMGFTHVDQLQSYLVQRIEKFLMAHGRKLIGWDEILKGGLASEATVMSWRGEAGGIAAARQGHDVVMTPGAYCYFDHYQSDPNTQPPSIGGYIPLRKVYSYDPVPEDSLTPAQQKHILGVQANLWTEWVPTTEHAEYMIFPRLLALSEAGWTAKKEKSFPDFHRRLQSQYALLQQHFVNYYRPSYRIHIQALPDYNLKENLITFNTEQYKPVIHYTLNGNEPTIQSPVYTGPFYVKGKDTIQAIIFKNKKAMDSAAVYVADYHKAIGKKVTYNNGGWSNSYPAQRNSTLTNGITGSLTYQDKQWQGFLHDMDVTVDMGAITSLRDLSMRFMQLIGPGVYIPNSVSVFLSDDNKNFTPAGKVMNDISPTDRRLLFKTFSFDLNGKEARYIRVKVDSQRGFMFTDEIRVD